MPRPRCNVPGRPDRDIWATVAVPTCPSPPEPKCSEAIKFCEPNIKRSDDGLAILRSNPIYRASDIIFQRGMRWRRDSIAILCNNRYRGTLLRKVLEATTTYPSNTDFTRSHSWPPNATMCGATGPNGATLAAPERLLQELVRLLLSPEGDCARRQPRGDRLVVPLRLGDIGSRMLHDQWGGAHKLVAAVQQYLKEHPSATKVVLNAVLNYSPNPWLGRFAGNASEDAAGLRTRQQLFDSFHHAVKGGARWRSEPVLDDDLCLLVRAPHILLPPRLDGFSALVSRLRYGR